MAKRKKNKIDKHKLGLVAAYLGVGILVLALAFVGSLDKLGSTTTLNLNAFAASDYKISVDQLSELYTVADISDTLGLASASDVASNYVLTTSMYDAGQTSTGKLEKPNITNLVVSRGVVEYTVQAGDTMESIAAKYGVTTDQIRWSNDRKTTEISEGELLYVPSVAGIVYTVRGEDTLDSIVSRYG